MKKIAVTLIFALIVLISSIMAFAADECKVNNEAGKSNTVTITVVIPESKSKSELQGESDSNVESKSKDKSEQKEESTDKSTAESTAETMQPIVSADIKLYPTEVKENFSTNRRQVVKTYELSPLDNPVHIPQADFELGGWKYSVTDILKHETANAEAREHKETKTLNTDTKDLEKILTLLAPTMEYKAEDEFAGILALDMASIKVETAGTKTSTYEMKVTREYPNLSANDPSLVPKTVTENGKTYSFAGVTWKSSNPETVDYNALPQYYTAVATYTATGSSTKVTGYVTTADYVGTLAKLSEGKTIYTVYFEGTELRTLLEMTELSDDSQNNKNIDSDETSVDSGKENAKKVFSANSENREKTESVEGTKNVENTKKTKDLSGNLSNNSSKDNSTSNNSNDKPNIMFTILVFTNVLMLLCVGALCLSLLYFMKKGGRFNNEKIDNIDADADSNSDGGASDACE